jgi:hypothetical protein
MVSQRNFVKKDSYIYFTAYHGKEISICCGRRKNKKEAFRAPF